MTEQGHLIRSKEAFDYIERIEDPVTRALVKMAVVSLIQRTPLQKIDAPQTDLDLLYLVRALADFFAEHDVIARTLQGEKVGAWFDENGAEWA
jgi:hypothetical protein